MVLCPKCSKNVLSWNSWFKAFLCDECGFDSRKMHHAMCMTEQETEARMRKMLENKFEKKFEKNSTKKKAGTKAFLSVRKAHAKRILDEADKLLDSIENSDIWVSDETLECACLLKDAAAELYDFLEGDIETYK